MTGLPESPETPAPSGDELLQAVLLADHGSEGPYAAYQRLRQAAPVYVSSTGVVVLSRYCDCNHALRDRSLGKVDESLGFRLTEVPSDLQRRAMSRFRRTMLFRNPPDHGRLRRLVADTFTYRHVEELRAGIITTIERLLDEIADKQTIDVMTDLALPLPVTIIGDLLGIPVRDRAVAAPLVRDLVAPLEPAADAQAVQRATEAEKRLATYFDELITHKRIYPRNDLLSRLATARGDNILDHDECIGSAILLFAAGFETTTNLIGNGLAALFAHPDQMALLRDRPALAPQAVDELLRFDAPVQTNGRTALRPTVIGGVPIEPGQIVLTLLGAANRDPQQFDNPDALDVMRTGAPSLSFGAGIHFCLGAPLARLEGRELFPRLLRRFPRVAPHGKAIWRPGLSFRGLASLPASVV